jgi:ABC-type dipeptide/oligopeptide/nickel transport system permease component
VGVYWRRDVSGNLWAARRCGTSGPVPVKGASDVDGLLSSLPVIIFVVLLLAFLGLTAVRLGPRFLLRRLVGAVFVVLGVSFITFILGYLAPTSAVITQLGTHATPAAVAQLNHYYGLDLPWYEQYVTYLNHLLHFDLGYSYLDKSKSVWDTLRLFVPTSVTLGVTGTLLAIAVGVPMGLLAAVRANSRFDGAMQTVALVLYAVPVFVIIPFFQIVMLQLHTAGLPSLPVSGWGSLDTEVGPIVIFGATVYAYYLRLTRASMLEILQQDYVRTARAKGLRERVVVWRHAFRNAAIPLLTAVGPALAYVVIGLFIVESLFNIPGIGLQAITSIQGGDFPIVEATVMLLALSVVLLNLATDVAYGYADPRIRAE